MGCHHPLGHEDPRTVLCLYRGDGKRGEPDGHHHGRGWRRGLGAARYPDGRDEACEHARHL